LRSNPSFFTDFSMLRINLSENACLGLVVLTSSLATLICRAQSQTLSYHGIWNGQACAVEVEWANYRGLGDIKGKISISEDQTYLFTGNNRVSGQLDIEIPGQPVFRFLKSKSEGNTIWTLTPGGTIHFWRPTLDDVPLPKIETIVPEPKPKKVVPFTHDGKADPETTFSTGTWGVDKVSVTIHWDNFKGWGRFKGHIQQNKVSHSFTGSGNFSDELRIKLEGTYRENRFQKNGNGPDAMWSGTLSGAPLTFGRSSEIVPQKRPSNPHLPQDQPGRK